MRQVLGTTPTDKPVLSADGERLGTVYNLTMDVESGDLVSLLVEPMDGAGSDVPRAGETTADGRLRFPAESVQGLGDHLVVDCTA